MILQHHQFLFRKFRFVYPTLFCCDPEQSLVIPVLERNQMDFFETVKKRRSCRKFTSEPIPPATIQKALDVAFLAPNSSNLQPWEFYWVQSPLKKKALVEACFSQNAAATAVELVVAVARIDTWKRNRKLLLETMTSKGKIPSSLRTYYDKVVPMAYTMGPFSLFALLKWPIVNLIGLFRPVPRGPLTAGDVFEVVAKTTALACENFMLALTAQGFDSCPMEGFDEVRIKKILGLNRKARVVMAIGIGKGDPSGIYGERIRIDPSYFVHKI
jgi:nitroreductase